MDACANALKHARMHQHTRTHERMHARMQASTQASTHASKQASKQASIQALERESRRLDCPGGMRGAIEYSALAQVSSVRVLVVIKGPPECPATRLFFVGDLLLTWTRARFIGEQ